jgi:hypothetical protein
MWRMLVPTVLVLAFVLKGCDRSEVQKRVDEMRERDAANERASIPLAVKHVRASFLIRGNEWFGALEDGTRLRLRSPKISAEPIKKGRPYCCRWLGEITVSAAEWQSDPPMDTSLPFSVSYTVLVQDSKRIEVIEMTGPPIGPLTIEEADSFPPSAGDAPVTSSATPRDSR